MTCGVYYILKLRAILLYVRLNAFLFMHLKIKLKNQVCFFLFGKVIGKQKPTKVKNKNTCISIKWKSGFSCIDDVSKKLKSSSLMHIPLISKRAFCSTGLRRNKFFRIDSCASLNLARVILFLHIKNAFQSRNFEKSFIC